MIEFVLNGKKEKIEKIKTIEEFVQERWREQTIAVAKNGTFISRSNYKTEMIEENSNIEIVEPMQGG